MWSFYFFLVAWGGFLVAGVYDERILGADFAEVGRRSRDIWVWLLMHRGVPPFGSSHLYSVQIQFSTAIILRATVLVLPSQ